MVLEYLYQHTNIFLFSSRLFGTAVSTILSFLAAMALFQPYINLLRRYRFDSELSTGTSKSEPVMPAGILFLVIITLTSLLTVRFNSYVVSALIIYTFFSLIGAVDDIAKVINKKRLAKGLITKQDYQYKADGISSSLRLILYLVISLGVAIAAYKYIPNISGYMSVPFLSIQKSFPYLPFWLFILFMTLTIAVMANGVNFTDGFDTLAVVPLITSYTFVGLVAYITSNEGWSTYLLIPTLHGVEELLPLVGCVIGTLLAFLWFNAPPSTIIMGDSGSVGLGGMVAILFIFTKVVFYLPIICFIFLLEFVSVVLQIGHFKLTRRRIFRMAPIHHHFQIGMRQNPHYALNEFLIKSKIAWRFHIISVVLLIFGLILYLKVH